MRQNCLFVLAGQKGLTGTFFSGDRVKYTIQIFSCELPVPYCTLSSNAETEGGSPLGSNAPNVDKGQSRIVEAITDLGSTIAKRLDRIEALVLGLGDRLDIVEAVLETSQSTSSS